MQPSKPPSSLSIYHHPYPLNRREQHKTKAHRNISINFYLSNFKFVIPPTFLLSPACAPLTMRVQ